jgi:hypothetical protein
MKPCVRVLFYSRPWNVELHVALEERWRRAGVPLIAEYVTQHLEARRSLARHGRTAAFLPDLVKAQDAPDPYPVLQDFEARYGERLLPLTRYVMSERFFARRGGDYQLDQLARHLLVWDELLGRVRPELLVTEGMDVMPGWIAHDLAVVHGCEPVALVSAPLPAGRLLRIRRHDELVNARRLYHELRERELTEEELAGAHLLQGILRGEGTKPDYLPRGRDWHDFAERLLNGRIIAHHVNYSIWQWRERLAGNYFVQQDQFVFRATQPVRALRSRLAETGWLSDPLPNRPYVFYPLHMEPEAALSVHGSYFENQLEIIRNLARSLPAAWDLVVKDHPVMRGLRPLRYLWALRRVPKVRVLPLSTPSNQVVPGARVVATVSSSAGLEAALLGRPVLVFGDAGWDHAPTVRKVGVLSNLPALLRELAGAELGPEHPDVLAFAASWNLALPPGRHHTHREFDWLQADNVEQVGRALDDALASAVPREPAARTA